MTLPQVLIIGGMKCGSTTLYQDLSRSDQICCSLDKEPENLVSDQVLSDDGRAGYESIYSKAKPGQICVDASTAYSKLPVYERVPQRAMSVLGADTKIVYIVRNPIKRIESHFHHNVAGGHWASGTVKDGLEQYSELIDFSRYAMQIKPWIDQFGPENIRVLVFEHYMDNRRMSCAQLWDWLGVDGEVAAVDEDARFNSSSKKPVMAGPFARAAQTSLYRKVLRPFLSQDRRLRLREALLPKSKEQSHKMNPDDAQRVRDELADDVFELRSICQRFGVDGVDPAAVWGFAEQANEVSG